MRVLGIDCGTEFTGFGVVEQKDGDKLCYLAAGAIQASKKVAMSERLSHIYKSLGALMEEHRPDVVAIEEVFYSVNAKSALKLGQVRGVAMLAAAWAGLPVAEYAPLAIKSSVVGYGRAEKQQVQHMVRTWLQLVAVLEREAAVGALAVANCH